MISKIRAIYSFVGKEVMIYFFFASLCGFLLFLVESTFIFTLQGFLVSVGLMDSNKQILPNWYPKEQFASIIILLVFGILRSLFYMLKSYICGISGLLFIKRQREKIVEGALLNAHLLSSSKIISLFTDRVTQAGCVLQLTSSCLLVLTSSILYFMTGLKLAPIEMILGVLSLLLVVYPIKKLDKATNNAGDGYRHEWDQVNDLMLSGLKNNFFLRIYNLISFQIKLAKNSLEKYTDHYRSYYQISAIRTGLPNLLGIFILCSITIISIKYIKTNGVFLLSFFYLFIRFTQSLSEMSTSYTDLRLHLNGLKELFRWHTSYTRWDQSPTINEQKDIDNLKEVNIESTNLMFGYKDSDILFSNLSFVVHKNEILLIRGASGSGKSTLLLLILGILKPLSGKIIINGKKETYEISQELSKTVGYVGPEPYIIQGTIRENLLFGNHRQQVSENEMTKALTLAQLDQDVSLDEFINEHAALSTGQKQRLSIARAILRNPKLLILDEATANLDSETEKKLINCLHEILKNCTTIVISHKESFDSIATQRIFLEKH